MIKIEDLLNNINNIINNNNLSKEDSETLIETLAVLNHLKHNSEDEETFQGDIKKPLNLRDILDGIEVPKLNKRAYVLDENDPKDKELLNMPVILLEDDGMGYGALNGACRDAYVSDYDKDNKKIHLWF